MEEGVKIHELVGSASPCSTVLQDRHERYDALIHQARSTISDLVVPIPKSIVKLFPWWTLNGRFSSG